MNTVKQTWKPNKFINETDESSPRKWTQAGTSSKNLNEILKELNLKKDRTQIHLLSIENLISDATDAINPDTRCRTTLRFFLLGDVENSIITTSENEVEISDPRSTNLTAYNRYRYLNNSGICYNEFI